MICAIDHVQLAMPVGGEERARSFYSGILGLLEIEKPARLKARGGCWFESANVKIHLGVEKDFRASEKAHVGLTVDDLDSLIAKCAAVRIKVVPDEPLETGRGPKAHAYIFDPFGNRVEVIAL